MKEDSGIWVPERICSPVSGGWWPALEGWAVGARPRGTSTGEHAVPAVEGASA